MAKIGDLYGELAIGFRREGQENYCIKDNAAVVFGEIAEAANAAPPKARERALDPGANFCGYCVEMAGLGRTACPATIGGHQLLRMDSALTSGSPPWVTRA